MIISSADDALSRRTRRAHNQFSEFIKGPSTSQLQRTHAAFPETPSTSKTPGKKRGKQKTTAAELESFDAPDTSVIPPPAPRKRRKTVTASTSDVITETIPSAQPTLDLSKNIPARGRGRTTRSSRCRPGPSTTAPPATLDLPPKYRKVILRVTQPENALEQLLQRSQDPRLSMLTSRDGKNNAVISKLQARAKVAADLAEKRAELCRSGWYLPLDRNGERRREPPEEPERGVSAWDVVLKAIEAAYRPEPPYIVVTRRIHEAVRARTELGHCGQVTQSRLMRGTARTKGSKKQRDDPETIRCKKLAKATLELVVDQWKRVVLASIIRVL